MKKRGINPKSDEVPRISADHKPELLPPSPISGHALPVSSLFKVGNPGNPGGAPKGKRVTTWLAEYQNMSEDEWPTGAALKRLPVGARIALAQLRKAMRDPSDLDPKMDSVGLAAAAWAADRVEGGVDRTVHLTHKQQPTMTPEQVAQELKNAGLTGPADVPKLDEF